MLEIWNLLLASVTRGELGSQWTNPGDVLSLLLIIGGDIVRNALAQLSGSTFVPVCFSCGWVAYAFLGVIAVAGDGRLMPQPDYNCKVINLENGYARENKSWVIGRLLRDLETPLTDESFSVTVYEAADCINGTNPAGQLSGGRAMWIGLGTIAVQLGVALIPLFCYGDWGILMVTAVGTIMALLTGRLRQWRVEKLACRRNTWKNIAITSGNGSRHVIIILGMGRALDLEDMAAGEGPRAGRVWLDDGWFVRIRDSSGNHVKIPYNEAEKDYAFQHGVKGRVRASLLVSFKRYLTGGRALSKHERNVRNWYIRKHSLKVEAILLSGLPADFWITRIYSTIFLLSWGAVLISVAGLKENSWFLLIIGVIGMVQNALIAAMRRPPEARGVYLNKKNPIRFIGSKVMDVLMDVEECYEGTGRALCKEFFPAPLDGSRGEVQWWEGHKDVYNERRYLPENKGSRYDGTALEVGDASRGRRQVVTTHPTPTYGVIHNGGSPASTG